YCVVMRGSPRLQGDGPGDGTRNRAFRLHCYARASGTDNEPAHFCSGTASGNRAYHLYRPAAGNGLTLKLQVHPDAAWPLCASADGRLRGEVAVISELGRNAINAITNMLNSYVAQREAWQQAGQLAHEKRLCPRNGIQRRRRRVPGGERVNSAHFHNLAREIRMRYRRPLGYHRGAIRAQPLDGVLLVIGGAASTGASTSTARCTIPRDYRPPAA